MANFQHEALNSDEKTLGEDFKSGVKNLEQPGSSSEAVERKMFNVSYWIESRDWRKYFANAALSL
jgi:hypothetical protein